MRIYKRSLSIILCLLLCLSVFPIAAQAGGEVLRIGIFDLGQFMYLDEGNEAHGYCIDYLDQLAQTTHWQYEYVNCGNWITATQMLEDGQIDLLAPAQMTEALSARFDYAAVSMGTEAAAIFALADRKLQYEDFDQMSTLTFGCAENSTFAKKFVSEYCPENGLNPTILYYANTTELQAALTNGEVDAIVTNIMFTSDENSLLGWFSLMPVYLIAQKGNTALLSQLNRAIMQLTVSNPSFTADLESAYFPIFSNTNFTDEERRFMETLPTITIGYEVNHAPLSAQDEEGNFTGITRDILERVSQLTGITFAYQPLPATGVTYDYLQKNQIYMISNVEFNAVNSSMKKMHLTSPYLNSEKVLVARESLAFHEDTPLTIALATGSGTLESAILEQYPNFTFQTYATVEACMDAVLSGTADGTLQNRYVADCVLEMPRYAKLAVIPIQAIADKLCLATLEFEGDNSELGAMMKNGLLISILDKAIAQLTTSELNSFVITNRSMNRYQLTLGDFLYKYWLYLAAITCLMLVCILLLLNRHRLEAAQNRTLEGKNAQLADAVRQAERANVAKSQFLSRMSHEIRTPMNAIVGLTAIARRHEDEPEKIEEYLEKIDASSLLLLNIINDVLDMSAIESEKLKIAENEFDLKQVLNGISTIYYTQCKQKGVNFSMLTNIADEHVIGDSLRVNQILMNLVSNAYKFTPAGGRIEIAVTQTGHRNDTVFIRFTVKDTGCGMSKDMLDRLFKPFEQESADTAQKHGGSGLGMSIAKNLVSMMHGAISVESEKDKGTTFTVDLPFKASGKALPADASRLKAMKALLVDDDADALLYASAVMDRLGLTYDTAASGEEALAKMQAAKDAGNHYDICFVDWKMPGMDGLAFTREARKLFDRETVVIIISAYDVSEVADEARSAGANQFVAKPLFQSTVFNVLMQVTGGVVAESSSQPESYDFGGKRVLLAEDNEINTEIATDLLEMVNLQVGHAADGRQALDMFTAAAPGTYQLVLMDIQMPNMDGYEATRQIRASAHPDAKTVPIYAMTANAFTEDVSNALSAGMNGHLAKPIDTAILYKTIYKVLNKAN